MKKIKFYTISSGLFSIIMGVMIALLRGSILSLLITVVGIGFILSGLAFGLKNISKFSIVKVLIGICTIAFGNTFINLSMYILGISLIVLGIFQFSSAVGMCKKHSQNRYMLTSYIRPVLTLAAGVCITFNPMGSVETLFLICGILLIAGGAWDLYLGSKWRN